MMKFKPRDKIVVNQDNKYIEGFVLQINEEEDLLYVILHGQNQTPELVSSGQCQYLTPETEKLITPPQKRKRGRPRKQL